MKFVILLFGLGAVVLFLLSGCMGQANRLPELRAVSEQNVDNGRRLIAGYGCGSCHSIPGVPGADAVIAPPLDRFYERSYIAGQFPNTWENLIQWIQRPQEMKPGTAMPDLGVGPTQAAEIAAYLFHHPAIGDMAR